MEYLMRQFEAECFEKGPPMPMDFPYFIQAVMPLRPWLRSGARLQDGPGKFDHRNSERIRL
jgi:hypothetical protein